ncbi:MAG: hypothetical protein ACRCZJ_07595 [Erysipelotrichaceae bacterium]
MEEVRSKKLKKRYLPKGNTAVAKVDIKPVKALYVLFFMGVALFLLSNYFVGGLVIAFCCYALFFTSNKHMIEFYDTYVLFLDPQSEDYYLVFYNEILTWKYHTNRKGVDYIEIKLVNHEALRFVGYDKAKVLKQFRKFVPQRVEGTVQEEVKM